MAPPSENILWKLDQVQQALGKPLQQSENLCWLGHLVGDIHQPMHCVGHFSPVHPRGDRGGNDEPMEAGLYPAGSPASLLNLHSYWDSAGLAYLGPDATGMDELAARLRVQYPRSSFSQELARQSPTQWAAESYDLAVNVAYPGRQTPGYQETAHRICLRRIALAGYRLADALTGLGGD